jgi:hypothetical protein
MKTREEIIAEMLRWSEEFIEQPHWSFGELPVCPFARAARLKRTIRFEVLPFDLDDPLDPDGEILSLAGELVRDPGLETLFVIHPEPAQVGARALEAFVARLNDRLAVSDLTSGLQAFEAHPDSDFCIAGVYTRRGPYPSLQVLRHSLLKTASDALLGTSYYDQFTPDMLRAVGMPRHELHGASPHDGPRGAQPVRATG